MHCLLKVSSTLFWALCFFNSSVVAKNDVEYTEIPILGDDYRSVVETMDKVLEPIYALSKNFIDATVPVNFDIGLLADEWEWTEFIEAYNGLTAFVIAILVIGVLIPVIGIIFAIARCAGFCGSKPTEKQPEHGKGSAIVAGVLTTVFSAFLVFAILVGIYGNVVLDNGSQNIFNKAITSMEDAAKYSQNTRIQLETLMQTNYVEFSHGFSQELSGISAKLNDHLNSVSKPEQLTDIKDGLGLLKDSIGTLQETRTSMDNIKKINIPMTNTVTTNLYNSCLREPVTSPAEPVCRQIEQWVSQWTVPTFDFPDVSAEIAALETVDLDGLIAVLTDLQGFGDRLFQKIEEVSILAKEKTDDAGAEIQAHLAESKMRIDQVGEWLDERTADVEDARKYYDDYGKLRFGLTFILPIVLTAMFVFVVLGLFIGMLCPSPYYKEKNCSSNSSTASEFFMINVSLIYIFALVFAVAVVGFYGFGLLGQRYLCNTLDTMDNVDGLKYFDETLDIEEYFGDGVTLGHLLTSCKANKAIYEVLVLENVFDLEDVGNYSETFGIKAAFEKFKSTIYDEIELLLLNYPRHPFELLKTIGLQEININLYTDQAEIMEHLVALLEEAYDLDSQLNVIPVLVQTYNNFIGDFRGLEVNYGQFVTEIKMGGTGYRERLAEFDVILDEYQRNIVHGGIGSLAGDLADECLDTAQTYLNRIQEKMLNSVGSCEPASVAIEATLNEVCGNVINPLNAIWVANFFALVAFVPLLILFIYLVSYYRQYVITDEDRNRQQDYYPYHPPGTRWSQVQAYDVRDHHQLTSPPFLNRPIPPTPPSLTTHPNLHAPASIPRHMVTQTYDDGAAGLAGAPAPTPGPMNERALGVQGRNLRRQLEYPYAMKGTSIAGSDIG